MSFSARVYIVLVNWNGWSDTIECVESIRRMDYPNYHILIVDNGSDDDSTTRLSNACGCSVLQPPIDSAAVVDYTSGAVTLICAPSNSGFAAGCNIGMQAALATRDCEYIWLLNNDTRVDSRALTALVDRYKESPEYGMVGSTLLLYDAPEVIQTLGGKYNPVFSINRQLFVNAHLSSITALEERVLEQQIDYVVGASILISRSFVEQVGLMDEQLFFYFEELDWRFRSKQFRLGYAKNSLVYHKVGRAINSNKGTVGREHYYWIRNRILLTRKHFPQYLPSVVAHIVATMLKHLLTADSKFVRMTFRALIDGLTGRKGKLCG